MPDARHLDRTRAAYDQVAVDYADLLRDELDDKPLDRALLTTFGERVQASGGGLVADVGCGPGRITAFLDHLGMQTHGVDLSPAMVETARQAHPLLSFTVGSMDALDLADHALGGLVAWYSIIHTAPALLPAVFTEFRRVLRTDGQLLLAFQIGEGPVLIERAYGHQVSLDAYRFQPDQITDLLEQAGFAVDTTVTREPMAPERTRQAYLIGAAKPAR